MVRQVLVLLPIAVCLGCITPRAAIPNERAAVGNCVTISVKNTNELQTTPTRDVEDWHGSGKEEY